MQITFFSTCTNLNLSFAFPLLVLGVDILPPVPSVNSSESVSFPEVNKQTGNINLPASLMWRAQHQGYYFKHCDFPAYSSIHVTYELFGFICLDGVSISNLLLSNVSVAADPQSSK